MRLFLLTALALFASFTTIAQTPDFTPPTPLFAAITTNNTAELKRLLDAGTNPNDGRMLSFSPVMMAIVRQNQEMVESLIRKGADLNAVDMVGSTTLMWAAANDSGSDAIIQILLKHGVDPNVRNKMGESALDWAQRRGQTPAVAALRHAADRQDPNRAAVEKALALLQKSGPQFTRVSGCVSCHHQTLPAMAAAFAQQRGYATNEKTSQQELAATVNMFRMFKPAMDAKSDQFPDIPISVPYLLMGMHAQGYPADELTAAAVRLIASKQRADGGFNSFPARPPMESSDITAAALSIRAMQLYGDHQDAAIRKAGKWLLTAQPKTTEELSMRLLGLAWANEDHKAVQAAAKALVAAQRPEGGWAQLPTLESDAYATGQALYALHQSAQMTTNDAVYHRAASFLLRTQLPDGSWHVRTRAFPFQPLKDSGFPHGRDQWISASGTGWAAMALSLPSAVKPHESSGND